MPEPAQHADYGWLHEVLGLDSEEYERRLSGGESMPATLDPRWHSHPILGITGHAHSRVEDARRPHGHYPEVGWNFDPVFVQQSDGSGGDDVQS